MKKLSCWLTDTEGSPLFQKTTDFTIYNLPFGIFSTANSGKRVGVAIGDFIIDMPRLAILGLLDGVDLDIFSQPTLNPFIALGQPVWRSVRQLLQEELSHENSFLREFQDSILVPQSKATLHLPIEIGDYTDFYSSIEHATNVGKLFRDPENALLPNWRHLPVAYHGRASSIVVSGAPIHRPLGQFMPKTATEPVFGASRRLDFELEMAFVVGKPTKMGERVSTSEAENHIFGVLLFNDWSARDIQQWEYQPLGPFLGKNFASSVSPWIVPFDALDPFRVATPEQSPTPLPYLQFEGLKNFDIHLEVAIQPKDAEEATTISHSNSKYLYWNMAQQLAHHTVGGCNIRVGDLMASGTISGKTTDSYGSLLEATEGGKKPLILRGPLERYFLEDFDTVTMRGFCERDGIRIGFGEVKTMVLPALDF
jgi:fumarylacetoacetase